MSEVNNTPFFIVNCFDWHLIFFTPTNGFEPSFITDWGIVKDSKEVQL